MSILARPGIAMKTISGPETRALPPLAAHIVSTSAALCSGLTRLAETGEAGPFEFEFSGIHEGIEPLLMPGIDAIVIDIGAGDPAAFDFLRRVVALGPNAPVIAVGLDDPLLQTQAIEAGAEDSFGSNGDNAHNLCLALRRAITRHTAREKREAGATKPH